MALNPISDMSFNGEDWTNDTLYPTYEGSAEKVRDDLNRMHFIMRNFLNDNVIPTLNQIIGIIGDAVTIAVPDGSITHAKLSAVGSEPGPAVALDNMQANSVGTEQLIDDCVTAAKIADGAVQRGHLASGAVGPGNLSQGAVLETNMGQNSVDTLALKNGAVTNDKLAGSISADKLAGGITNAQLAGSISNDKLAGGITNDKLAGSISADKLAGGITNSQLAGSISNGKLAGNIEPGKMKNLNTSGYLWQVFISQSAPGSGSDDGIYLVTG